MYGYIIIPRTFLENEELCRGADFLAVYAYILANVCFKEGAHATWEKKQIKLKKGEMVTSIRKISKKTKIPKSNVARILESFKNWDIIRTRSNTRQTLISVDIKELFNMCFGTKSERKRDEIKEKQDEKEKRSKREKEELKELTNKKNKEEIPPISPKGMKKRPCYYDGCREQQDVYSSFDTDEFFQAALERSAKRISERAKMTPEDKQTQ